MKYFLIISVFLFGIFAQAFDCEKFFLKSKIKPGTVGCRTECGTLQYDLSNYDCSLECEKFCDTYIKPELASELAEFAGFSLTPGEQSLLAKFPKDAALIFKAKMIAENATQRLFGRNGRNDESDAFRHFMWSGLSTEASGEEKAKAFLDAHEAVIKKPVIDEMKMDLENNNYGSASAIEIKGGKEFQQKLEKEALKLIREKKLNVISPKGKVPEWVE